MKPWKATLVGGPRHGMVRMFEVPWPHVGTPEGVYHRRTRLRSMDPVDLTYCFGVLDSGRGK